MSGRSMTADDTDFTDIISSSHPWFNTSCWSLFSCTNLTGAVWTPVPGQADIPGTGAPHTLTDPAPGSSRFYRVGVSLP